jgi:hypothetical protein
MRFVHSNHVLHPCWPSGDLKKITTLCKSLSINVRKVLLQFLSPNYNHKTSVRISTTNYAYPSFSIKVQKNVKEAVCMCKYTHFKIDIFQPTMLLATGWETKGIFQPTVLLATGWGTKGIFQPTILLATGWGTSGIFQPTMLLATGWATNGIFQPRALSSTGWVNIVLPPK